MCNAHVKYCCVCVCDVIAGDTMLQHFLLCYILDIDKNIDCCHHNHRTPSTCPRPLLSPLVLHSTVVMRLGANSNVHKWVGQ